MPLNIDLTLASLFEVLRTRDVRRGGRETELVVPPPKFRAVLEIVGFLQGTNLQLVARKLG
jgi:hypothetical protein